MYRDHSADNIQTWTPAVVSKAVFSNRCQSAIDAIKATMAQVTVTTVGMSYGKDSVTTLVLALEAARQIQTETGTAPKILLITADTGVENPLQTKLAVQMSNRVLEWADERGLDVEQTWVTPDPINSYLVSMLGMRGVASVPGASATCSIQLKVEPMNKKRKELAKTYGAENIGVLTGVRHEESTVRSANMTKRGESATEAFRTETGSLQLAPIADWTEADVWRLLNTGARTSGFEMVDCEPVILHYELQGDATCGTVSIGQTAKSAGRPCSGGRGGCFICQKVDTDHSFLNVVEKVPYLEPLARLSRLIRAGHFVPENRNFISKGADEQNRVRVFSNAYSAPWTSYLLSLIMSLDEREDEYARAKSAKLGRKVARRFPRLLTLEQQLLIAFQWSRYGVQAPGEYARIREAILQGERWDLPTDEELSALAARADRKLMGKTFGYLQSDFVNTRGGEYRDHYRDLIGTETGCSPQVMLDDDGDRDLYVSGKGIIHDTIELSDIVEADLSDFESEIELEDFLWWYAMEFAAGEKGHNEEMNFLLREGVIRARSGYQSQLAEYQRYNLHLHAIREKGPIGSLEQIMAHPQFVTADQAKATEDATSNSAPAIIATDRSTEEAPAKAKSTETDQLDLFTA
ncbi:phosphoadenosine phosphosulfate reductase domain-containing protein [Marinobacter salarius]|uniref:Sulfurtransferase DndC n=1 Tax=Marinobacter salarius TaxID=1420917 RepID=A0A1W6KFM5_9GAMM|nr:phosphoadenosine phosphosulfate reductase family protein [Marinobacter salarius]ARM86129.1 sulfurtransferase DndC [Marinobacter salarius]